MSVLTVDGLTKNFGGFAAVDDVSLAVEHGEMRGLIGSNGAGKSTLLHLIYGRIFPDHGSIRFGEIDVTKMPVTKRARLGMGLVFQVTSVFDGLTVEENLLLGALPKEPGRSDPIEETAVDRVMQLVELSEVRRRHAGNLSHGEKQWLEIGMVLLTEPSLLLLDEPTSGMTQAESRRTADLLHHLRSERAIEAVIVVEHNIEFIRLVSDRVTVMHRGSVLSDGTIDEVQDDKAVQDSYLGRLR
ncbi:MAG: ATP-binding cassette domain-containing protein [Acidimicrobiia bacterium]|nr:ATP-binding cassette domain-containing protein [Acidimicrobiia bacterium]